MRLVGLDVLHTPPRGEAVGTQRIVWPQAGSSQPQSRVSKNNTVRQDAIGTAKSAKKCGNIVGSLGWQGNPNTTAMIERQLAERGIPVVNLL